MFVISLAVATKARFTCQDFFMFNCEKKKPAVKDDSKLLGANSDFAILDHINKIDSA